MRGVFGMLTLCQHQQLEIETYVLVLHGASGCKFAFIVSNYFSCFNGGIVPLLLRRHHLIARIVQNTSAA